jgi:hypothetical protein
MMEGASFMEDKTIDEHLQEALRHLEAALHQSVRTVLDNENEKAAIGAKWEKFLGGFFSEIRETGKRSKLNLLGLISFPRLK